jgi:hypothetical protein
MRQGELFGIETGPRLEVPGFRLRPDYITVTEEQQLLAQVELGEWQTDIRRRVQVYGLGYSGNRRRGPRWVRDFPDWLTALAERVMRDAPLERFPDNSVINE